MAKLQRKTISRRTVEALEVDKDTVFWDRDLPGFGVRVYPAGGKVYVVQTRAGGRAAKRVTVGRHGIVTAEEARRRAALIIARIKAGEEPVAEPPARAADGPAVAELARLWLDEDVAVRCKAKTAKLYQLVVNRHIAPALGSMPALAVGHAEVTQLHHALRGSPVMANRVVEALSRIYNAAGDRGHIPEAFNPCRRVVKYRERARERFLSDAEFRRLGRVLDEAETRKGVSAHAVAAIRLLLLTGCRTGEILNLRWSEVDLEANELRLPDTKTGPRTIVLPGEAAGVLAAIPRVAGNPHVIPGKVAGRPMRNLNDPWEIVRARMVPLSRAAAAVLSALPRADGNPWVIAGRKPGAHLTDLQHPWRRIRARAGLGDVRIHDLRHSFASRALALGESLPMIGKLLGHTHVQTTARYAHLANESVKASGSRVGDSIGLHLEPTETP